MSIDQLSTTQRHQPPPLTVWPDGVLGRLSFPSEPQSIGHARSFVRLAAESWNAGHVADNAARCVSELATNAHKHAASDEPSPFVLIIRRTCDRLRCEIHDRSPKMPQLRDGNRLDEAGRGLFLVAAIADDHGSYPTPRGKAVWFELTAWSCEEPS